MKLLIVILVFLLLLLVWVMPQTWQPLPFDPSDPAPQGAPQ